LQNGKVKTARHPISNARFLGKRGVRKSEATPDVPHTAATAMEDLRKRLRFMPEKASFCYANWSQRDKQMRREFRPL
jgi:hypothetical protein